jgi:hypothetical protein
MSVSIAKAMYDYTGSWGDKAINHISPSMLGGCMRKHYYAIIGVPKTTAPGPGAQLNFELGRMWEAVMEKSLRFSGIPFISQYKMFDEELNVKGTLDFLLYDPETQEWEVVDSKTESVYSDIYRKRGNETFLSANKDYVYQVNAYALMCIRQGFKVSKGRFGVITKDNGKIDEYPLFISTESLAKTESRIEQLNGFLQRQELPPCECAGWKIGYCNYGDPHTQKKSSTGKTVNTTCCSEQLIEEWKGDK